MNETHPGLEVVLPTGFLEKGLLSLVVPSGSLGALGRRRGVRSLGELIPMEEVIVVMLVLVLVVVIVVHVVFAFLVLFALLRERVPRLGAVAVVAIYDDFLLAMRRRHLLPVLRLPVGASWPDLGPVRVRHHLPVRAFAPAIATVAAAAALGRVAPVLVAVAAGAAAGRATTLGPCVRATMTVVVPAAAAGGCS